MPTCDLGNLGHLGSNYTFLLAIFDSPSKIRMVLWNLVVKDINFHYEAEIASNDIRTANRFFQSIIERP